MRIFKTKQDILEYLAGTEIEVMVDMGRLGTFWNGWDIPLFIMEKNIDWFEEIQNEKD